MDSTNEVTRANNVCDSQIQVHRGLHKQWLQTEVDALYIFDRPVLNGHAFQSALVFRWRLIQRRFFYCSYFFVNYSVLYWGEGLGFGAFENNPVIFLVVALVRRCKVR